VILAFVLVVLTVVAWIGFTRLVRDRRVFDFGFLTVTFSANCAAFVGSMKRMQAAAITTSNAMARFNQAERRALEDLEYEE